MKATVKIYNCPEDAYGYIVCRLNDGELWYWGCYDTRFEATKVTEDFENVVIVERRR